MAYSFAALSATELALAAAGKPKLIANVLDNPAFAQWRISGSFGSGADITESTYPTYRAYDGKTHLHTRPTGTQSDIYLMFDMGADNLIEFDWFAIIGHNFKDALSDVTITLQIADDSAFSTNLISVASGTFSGSATSNQRVVFYQILHTGSTAMRYTGVRYVRLRLQCGLSLQFEIGELILGRQRQLKHKPNVPWDDYALGSDVESTESISGIITKYVRYKGRREFVAEFNPHESAYINDFQAWWEQLDYGVKPFYWQDDPSTVGGQFQASMFQIVDSPMLRMPVVGPSERVLTIGAVEQAPDFEALE